MTCEAGGGEPMRGIAPAGGWVTHRVDVLNSQADAKARLIGAQRDRVIASYTLLSAVGRLGVRTLRLNTPEYLPEVHYHQVRDLGMACERLPENRIAVLFFGNRKKDQGVK